MQLIEYLFIFLYFMKICLVDQLHVCIFIMIIESFSNNYYRYCLYIDDNGFIVETSVYVL